MYVNFALQSMRSCSQRPLTSLASTDPSVEMSVTSSYIQSARSCSAIILHGRKKFLNNLFNVTMGSFDGTEMCKLVGCYLLSLLTDKFTPSISLYRHDGLVAFNKTPQEIEKIKIEQCKIFHENGLKITIEGNKTIVNFLDIMLDLQSGKNTIHTQRKVTSHCTCTRNPIIHHLSWKTFQIPPTNGFQKYHHTYNALTMPKLCSKTLWSISPMAISISIATGIFWSHSSAMNLKVKFLNENQVIAFKSNLYGFQNAIAGW